MFMSDSLALTRVMGRGTVAGLEQWTAKRSETIKRKARVKTVSGLQGSHWRVDESFLRRLRFFYAPMCF